MDAVRARAHLGLEKSQGGLFRTRFAASTANDALQDVIQLAGAAHDAGSLQAARVGQATADALKRSPTARLGVLRATLAKVEGCATGSVGYLSQMGYALLDAMDQAKLRPEPRAAAVRAYLDATARSAADQGLREADYARYAADLGAIVPNPVYALNMLDRVNCSTVPDVTRASWFASVATSFSYEAEFDRDDARQGRILQLADPQVRALAEKQHDAATLQHLDREKRYTHGLSPGGQRAVHMATLRVIGDEVPYAPETALVMAYQALRQDSIGKDERRQLVAAAFAEARQGSCAPTTPAGAWLRFHDDVAGVGFDVEMVSRLERSALHAIVDGRGASVDLVKFDLEDALRRKPDAAGAVFSAAARLEGADSDAAVAALGHKMGPAMLRHAFERIQATPSDRADRKALLDIAQASLQQPGDHDAIRRDFLERIARLDTDKIQKLLLDAAQPEAKPAATIQRADDYVLIGTVRVPRKALQQG